MEGALGYGHWVCSLLLDREKETSEMFQYAIHQMSAIPAASDGLARYTGLLCTQWVQSNWVYWSIIFHVYEIIFFALICRDYTNKLN